MFQKAMSTRVGRNVNPKCVSRLQAMSFDDMNDMRLWTMMMFLQDAVWIDGLIGSLAQNLFT